MVPPDRYGMCYPVCEKVHINDLLLLIGKSNTCNGSSRFPLSIYPTSPNRKQNALNISVNSTFPSIEL